MIYLATFILAILPAMAVVVVYFVWVLPERRQNASLVNERARLRTRVAALLAYTQELDRGQRAMIRERHRARMRIAELCRERLDHACNRDTVRP